MVAAAVVVMAAGVAAAPWVEEVRVVEAEAAAELGLLAVEAADVVGATATGVQCRMPA